MGVGWGVGAGGNGDNEGSGWGVGVGLGVGVSCAAGTFGIWRVGVSEAAALIGRTDNSTPENWRSSKIFFENWPAKSNTLSEISTVAFIFKLLSTFTTSIVSPLFIFNFVALDWQIITLSVISLLASTKSFSSFSDIIIIQYFLKFFNI